MRKMAQAGRLKLDRDLSNNTFVSWRLDSSTDVQPAVHRLPGRVAPALAGSEGFLQTKTILQHNHMNEQPGGTYVFLQQGEEHPALHRLEYKPDTAGVAVHRLTGPLDGKAEAEATGGLLNPRLPPSVAEVRSSSGDGSAASSRLLASSGHGDLFLIHPAGSNPSPPICPLRAPPPLQGVRPFILEAAYESSEGKLQCICSVLRSKHGSMPAACEIFAITLSPPVTKEQPLHVDDIQLLQTSAARPYAIVPTPEQQLVLLAVDPAAVLQSGTAKQEAAQQAAAVVDSAPDAAESFDANPRSMEAAVANLARFTSDTPAGGPISEQLADIDSETGPGGEGALGAEPEVALVLLSTSVTAGATEHKEVDRIVCGSHRLLGCSSGSDGGKSVLLGLTDDVDAAVVRIGISAEGAISADHVASLPALAYVVAGKVQRRAVLFGQPGSDVAAAVVEAHAYAYVYKAVAPSAKHGVNHIVPLRLAGESLGVLGSAQLATAGGSSSCIMLLTEDSTITIQL